MKSEDAKVEVHRGDLPRGISFGSTVAIDTETMGLDLRRDRLCVVQLSAGDGICHLVHFPKPEFDAPNLKALMADESVTKLFHFGRFDIAAIHHYLGVTCRPVFCTKIAAKMTRTFTDRHGLKALCKDLLGVDLCKEQQTSDWGAETLSEAQIQYAASDVLHLHALRDKLTVLLAREGRLALAQACFDFLPTRAELDMLGWGDEMDIFRH